MPSPKDGSPGTIVTPTDPDDTQEALNTDPGQVEALKAWQRETQTGRFGSVNVPAHQNTPAESDSDDASTQQEQPKKTWIEIQLVDEEGNPVAGEKYSVKCPDGTLWESTTDEKGVGRVENIDPGSCEIGFPDLDQDAWRPA